MLKQRFIFAVSLFAILAVGNVWADTASGDAVKTVHDVYEDLDTDETGIAGVSYVNKMVNAAGAAAQDAENHAASAGASALSAAAAASAAQAAADNAQDTADKVANKFDNTSTVKNAIVTTDANGKVAPVAISDNGTGTYVTGVTVSGGVVTLSRGTPTAYSLPTASASTKGGVKIGANVNVTTDGTISVPTANGTSLGLVKQGTNITIGTDGTISARDTTYSTGTATASGLTKLYTTTGTATDGTMTQAALNTALSGKQAKIENLSIIESGAAAGATAVQDVATGSANGTISVDGTDVAVQGLGSAAYTASGAYATAAQGALAAAALPQATFDAFQETNTAAIAAAKKAGTDAATELNTYKETVAETYQTKAAMATSTTQGVDSTNGDSYYPTVNKTQSMISNSISNDIINGYVGTLDSLETENKETIVDAINEVDAEAAAKLATVSSSGSGVVRTVVKDGTTVKVTAGTVATADIADGAVTTAKIADGAVTVAKTTGLYGVIPSGSQGNTAATAYIWVE